jgi:hypothetical protein
MVPEEKYRLAYKLKQSRMSWLEIGKILGGVTSERARKFAELHERKIKMTKHAVNEWEKELILRTNGTSVLESLRNMGLSDKLEKGWCQGSILQFTLTD